MLALWLPARIAVRLYAPGWSVAAVTAIPVLASAFGSMPFYTAYAMPDIFAPILLLVIATLTIFARQMRLFEILLAQALGLLAVVTHPSHLLITFLMIPLSILGAVLISGRRAWTAALLVILLALGGLAERALFATAVKTVKSSEVVYQPFLTARSIEDGPGLRVLEDNCPNDEIATCALYDALQRSSDPWRLTASHIMFERSENLGSYRLLPAEIQRDIAQEQISFFFRVLRERPVALTLAFLSNTLQQANLFSVEYTIPTEKTLRQVNVISDIAPASFAEARLLGQRGALNWLVILHGVVYAVSALLIVVILVLPQKAPPLALKGFVMMILCGILVNAFVCGGVSQPSDRYGARVAFLLPVAASFIILFYNAVRRQERS